MLQIPCPHCGPRDYTEFTYRGDASRSRPDTTDTVSNDDWVRYLFLRDNPSGAHVEHWYHAFGCRQWLKVARDTTNDAISDSVLARSTGEQR
ncbi:MAG: Sarcosine oxidase subunit delta [Acidimicrobiaceae bacterium]|nr:Sarcosine oxidase subunit delta [Acidimicrobiaceae bacterium]